MKAKLKYQLIERLKAIGFSYDEAQALRRIEMTLQRWAELECGDSNGWTVERNEQTGKPVMFRYSDRQPMKRLEYPVADREAAALKRLSKLMALHPSVVSYHQSDPRGCALYIVPKSELLDGAALDSVYTRGIAICV